MTQAKTSDNDNILPKAKQELKSKADRRLQTDDFK
jgi:hypothetical protein